MLRLFPLLLCLGLLAACSHDPIVPRADFFTLADNGKTKPIEIGGKFDIDLDGGDSLRTGWQLSGSLPNGIRMIGEPRFRYYSDEAGSTGVTTYRFRATKKGSYQLSFTLEGGRSFNLNLEVQEPSDIFDPSKRENESSTDGWSFF